MNVCAETLDMDWYSLVGFLITFTQTSCEPDKIVEQTSYSRPFGFDLHRSSISILDIVRIYVISNSPCVVHHLLLDFLWFLISVTEIKLRICIAC
jgi:hypothetical protein